MTGIRSSFVLLAMLALQAVGSAQATTSPAAPNRRPIVLAVDQTTPQPAGDAAVRKRAEDLATQATGRFSEILSEDKAAPGDEVFAPLWSWLSQAQSDYSDVIVAKLKHPVGDLVILAPPGNTQLAQAAGPAEAPRTEPAPQRALTWATIVESVANWLAQTNSSYRNEIVKKLERPAPGAPAVAAGEAPEAQSPPATRGMAPQPGVAPAPQPMAEAAPAPSPAPTPAPATNASPATAPEAQRTGDAAEQAAEDTAAKSRAEEIKRIADAEDGKRRAAEERRLGEAEAQRKAAAAKAEAAKAEARRRAEVEEAEDRAEAQRLAEAAEAERKAEAQRRADAAEAKRKAEEAKRAAAAAEAKRRAEAAEAERKAEAKRAADAAEAKRKAAEAKSAADAAEAKRKAEEQKRLIEEAEAERKAVDAAQRLAQAGTKSAPEAGPATIPAADTPAKQPEPATQPEPPAQDDGRQAANARSEPAQSAPVAPRAERRKARTSTPHKKRAQKARRKVHAARGGHYRSGRKVRRKVHRTRRYRVQRAWSGGGDGRVYVVRRGDTLSAIARRYYGTGAAYRAIYKANRGRIRNPHLIYPRQRIYIPQRRRWR